MKTTLDITLLFLDRDDEKWGLVVWGEKIKRLFVFISVVSTIFITATVSYGEQYWAKTYGGYHEEIPRSFKQTSDGGYVAISTSYMRPSPYVSDILIIKINEDGRILWQKAYDGSDDDWPISIQETTDGGYVLAGYTKSFGAGDDDFWILKLNEQGYITWQKTYGGAAEDGAWHIEQTSDGGYIVSGFTKSFGAGNNDIWVLKLDEYGDITWQKTFGGDGSDNGIIQQTADGGYLISGFTFSFGFAADKWILKLDSTGNVLWQKIYENCGGFVEEIPGEGYIMLGMNRENSLDTLIMKLDLNGNIIWQRTYAINNDDSANAIVQTIDGNYIVSGDTWSQYTYSNYFLKLDNNWDVLWQRVYDGGYDDSISISKQNPDGGYLLTGHTKSFGAGGFEIFMLKTDSNWEIPNCNTIDIALVNNPVVNTPSVNVYTSNALITSPSATGVDTSVVPRNSLIWTSVVCCDGTEDMDGDAVADDCDNCPDDSNPNQDDYDEDAIGDICDECIDTDHDGYGNPGFPDNICSLDNCPFTTNPDQTNNDSDSRGDACDNCPFVENENQVDSDGDNYGNSCDNCPAIYNPGQENFDLDELGDVCDPDVDGDGICNPGELDPSCTGSDNCPNIYNPGQEDFDLDNLGDVCDPDDDGDTIPDYVEGDDDPDEDGIPNWFDLDSDNDGVEDSEEVGNYPSNPRDTDADDTPDYLDLESDEDGILDSLDNCRITPNGPNAGTCYTWSEMASGTTCANDDDCGGSAGSCSMNQEDTYPPQGNNIGDVCDCECDFDCSGSVDASDVTAFLTDFGRSAFFNPCTNTDACDGDFDCNANVDANDVTLFLEDFGRSNFYNPCPACTPGNWCVYP